MKTITTLPKVLIEADGAPLPPQELLAVGSIRLQQRLSLPTLCELLFCDPPGPLSATSRLQPGAGLRISLRDGSEPLFTGQVTAIEHAYGPANQRQIRVRGYDRLHSLRKRQSVRAHMQVRLPEFAEELVADLGLRVQPTQSGPLWSRFTQHRQSDFDLLSEIAERSGLFFFLRHEVLHLLTLQGMGEPIRLSLGDSLLEARFEANGEPACRMVTVAGWNTQRVEPHTSQASSPRSGRSVPTEVSPGLLGGRGERGLLDEAAQDESQAQAIAQIELDRYAAYEVTLWGVAEGDPRLQPGARIALEGVADACRGQYVLSSVNHTLDDRTGFLSEFSTVPPPLRERPHGTTATYGVVTRVDDPEGLGRVQVALPTFQDLETDWMGVLAAGAGADKGLIILPDVGDTVLVLHGHGDPERGIVLGGLYGAQGAPDPGVEAGAVRRYTLLTPGGQIIRLDDGEQTVRLENGHGSYVELTPSAVRLHAAADLTLEAPGYSIFIRGQRIDFERA